MGWKSPYTYTANQVLTAALLNTYQRDNMLQTAPALASAAGDLFYATAPNKIGVLAAGSNRAALVYDTSDAAPEWTADATLWAVQSDIGVATSGTLTSSPTYTTHATATFTLPTGWGSAEIQAWGNVSVSQSDNNQNLLVRVDIGDTTGTSLDPGEMSINHDITASANNSATVTATTVVGVASTITGDSIGSLVFKNAQVGYIAIRSG